MVGKIWRVRTFIILVLLCGYDYRIYLFDLYKERGVVY
jgi:hypothetical protein